MELRNSGKKGASRKDYNDSFCSCAEEPKGIVPGEGASFEG
jgi:hypothetical protein